MNQVGIAMLAAVPVLVVTGCSAHHTQVHAQSEKPGILEARAASPDGKQVAFVRNAGNASYIDVGPAGSERSRTIYRSPGYGSITNAFAWPLPNRIIFEDGTLELQTIDVRTRSVVTIGASDGFDISADGRWLAWSQAGGQFRPNRDSAGRVGIIATRGGNCLEVPKPANRQDTGAFFKPSVKRLFFLRWPFDPKTYDPSAGTAGPSRSVSVPLSSLRRCN